MTTAVVAEARGFRPVNLGFAAAAVGVAVLLAATQAQFRRFEALASAGLLSLLRIAPADSLGTVVTFPARGSYVGFTVAAGCTAALLIIPFLLVAALLLLFDRVPPERAAATVATFAAVVMVVNQLRLMVIAAAIRGWGYPQGFDRSHVLMGTIVSTVGVAGGLLLFLRMVLPRSEWSPRE